jgi:hypothetical protein
MNWGIVRCRHKGNDYNKKEARRLKKKLSSGSINGKLNLFFSLDIGANNFADDGNTFQHFFFINDQWWSKTNNITMSWLCEQSFVPQAQTDLPRVKLFRNNKYIVMGNLETIN